LLLLSGCEVKLYTGLTEREGNEMLAILLDSGTQTRKEQDKDGNVTLYVEKSKVAKSIRLLKSNGYPKDKFSSIKEIFPKEGLISSPTEERARYTYATSQEIAATLSMIDGVLNARVHVVLPPGASNTPEDSFPSSASVFVKYTPELVLVGFIPKVKVMVSNSIEGLTLDKITVSLFPSAKIGSYMINRIPSSNVESVMSINVNEESQGRLYLVFGTLIVLFICCLGLGFWVLWEKFLAPKTTNVNDNVNMGYPVSSASDTDMGLDDYTDDLEGMDIEQGRG